MKSIYADANATTRPHSSVIEAMSQSMDKAWGNPSSSHSFGSDARNALVNAKSELCSLLDARHYEVVFTSGGTEANNLAILSAFTTHPGRHVITSQIEHPSALAPLLKMRRAGCKITYLRTKTSGQIDLEHLQAALASSYGSTALVSLMWANNETGVIQPVAEACALAHSAGALFHTDAVQAVGKLDISLQAVPVDFLALSAHKFCGPKGIGALVVSQSPGSGRRVEAQILGGSQQKGVRAGTENVPGIVGLSEAARISRVKLCQGAVAIVRDFFEAGMRMITTLSVLGCDSPRVSNTSLLRFPGFSGSNLVRQLDRLNVFVSTGSACHSGSLAPSKTLTSMGLRVDAAREVVRVSFLPDATMADAEALLAAFAQVLGGNVRQPTLGTSDLDVAAGRA